jgi:hypothetical protein
VREAKRKPHTVESSSDLPPKRSGGPPVQDFTDRDSRYKFLPAKNRFSSQIGQNVGEMRLFMMIDFPTGSRAPIRAAIPKKEVFQLATGIAVTPRNRPQAVGFDP